MLTGKQHSAASRHQVWGGLKDLFGCWSPLGCMCGILSVCPAFSTNVEDHTRSDGRRDDRCPSSAQLEKIDRGEVPNERVEEVD